MGNLREMCLQFGLLVDLSSPGRVKEEMQSLYQSSLLSALWSAANEL